ncbi:uncharacterized protein CBL_14657 [Carabus blaptoides fortunei]
MHFSQPIIFTSEKYAMCKCSYSNSETNKPPGYMYGLELTSDQQKYILQKLNEANLEELASFSLPKQRIKKLDAWRKKNGQFNTLVDVLDVDGLGVKSLDKLCKNILHGNCDSDHGEVKKSPLKTRGQLLTPLLNTYQTKELKSALGINLYTTGISWARIEKQNNHLSDWDMYEFDLGSKKLSPSDALQLVIQAASEIPTSDVYIFEAPISVTPTAQQSPISVSAYAQRVQILSMLITLLSTSPKHNLAYARRQEMTETDTGIKKHNHDDNLSIVMSTKVFFLRYRLPARLFRTLIGTERVSAATTVSNILTNNVPERMVYTPLSVNDELHSMYNKQQPINKEVLGQALLLTMAFMDICVYQNPASLKVISSNSR